MRENEQVCGFAPAASIEYAAHAARALTIGKVHPFVHGSGQQPLPWHGDTVIVLKGLHPWADPTSYAKGKMEPEREIVHRRLRVELADGGIVYLGCEIDKPKLVPAEISLCGVLDAKQLKGKV